MKNIICFIIEKLKLNKDIKFDEYTCHPKDRFELSDILEERLKEDKNADLNDIDISKLFSLNFLFKALDPHNIKIDQWNTSNIKHMQGVFMGCKNFDCDLSNWDVSNVEDMYGTFYGCRKFTGQGLENWNPKKCKNFIYTFEKCTSLKNKPSWYKK